MKKTIALATALGLVCAGSAFARAKLYNRYQSASSNQSSGSDLNTGMAGKIGIGFDSIPGATQGTATGAAGASAIPGLSNPNAFDLRYWMNDRLALDGRLALDFGSKPMTVGLQTVTASEATFGLGGGVKYNFAEPVQNLLVQFLGGISIANDSVSANGGSQGAFTFALFAGTGFEALIPAWPALSVEGNVGLGLMAQTMSQSGGGNSTSSTSTEFGISGEGFTPISVSAHYYF